MDMRGKYVVVTGKVAGESRQTAQARLRDVGAIVQSAVGPLTDVLVTGDRVGAKKTQAAAARGVKVIPWEKAMNGDDGSDSSGGAPSGAPRPAAAKTIAPMLAKAGPLPEGPEWLFEIKWDGYRCIATVEDGAVAMQSRSAKTEYTQGFAHVAAELAKLPDGVYDGELVVVGEGTFGTMHSKGLSSFVIYDMLEHGLLGSLRKLALVERRKILTEVVPPDLSWITVSPAFDDGHVLLKAVKDGGGEGVVAKRKASRYMEGSRTEAWTKVKCRNEQDFAVVGWKPGEGARGDEAGSILLAVWNAKTELFDYVGRVGTAKTGEDGTLGGDFWRRQMALPVADGKPAELVNTNGAPNAELRDVTWVKPQLVVQVRFQRWTEDGRLFHPSVVAVRNDVGPYDTRREG